jgi:hypothetical protein
LEQPAELKLIVLPQEIVERLKFLCEAENLGMSLHANELFNVILIGRVEAGLNTIHLMAANLLISSVLSGSLELGNELLKEDFEKKKTKEKMN